MRFVHLEDSQRFFEEFLHGRRLDIRNKRFVDKAVDLLVVRKLIGCIAPVKGMSRQLAHFAHQLVCTFTENFAEKIFFGRNVELFEKGKGLLKKLNVSAFNLATIYAGLGEDDKTFVELERAYNDRSRSLAWLNVMPEYDRLRNSPRFMELVRKVGLPQQN